MMREKDEEHWKQVLTPIYLFLGVQYYHKRPNYFNMLIKSI